MRISFNGTLAPYTYNCPYAHKLRNICKIYPSAKDEEEKPESDELSKRQLGIQNHELCNKYIVGDIEEIDFATDYIEWAKNPKIDEIVTCEQEEFYELDMSFIGNSFTEDLKKRDHIYCRKDVVISSPYSTTVLDWKFGNSEYGITKYYDEVEFFIALEAAKNPDIGEWNAIVHFPVEDYTLPKKTYGPTTISRLQLRYTKRIERILNDRFYRPNPGRVRCRFCDYRSEEAGGTGDCEYSFL